MRLSGQHIRLEEAQNAEVEDFLSCLGNRVGSLKAPGLNKCCTRKENVKGI